MIFYYFHVLVTIIMLLLLLFCCHPTCSPVRLPQASAPTILPRPMSPARPPPAPEVRPALISQRWAPQVINWDFNPEWLLGGTQVEVWPLTFQGQNVLSNRGRVLPAQVSEVRGPLRINVRGRWGNSKKKREDTVRRESWDWETERIQNEPR